MSGVYKAKFARAKAYIEAHPDESKEAQAKACSVSTRLIAMARAELIKEGVLAPSRKEPIAYTPPERIVKTRKKSDGPPADTLSGASPPTGADVGVPGAAQPSSMRDHQAMQALADILEELDDIDDESIHKRLLKQCLTFAFNPSLHPDTRMSASQMWAKLKDQQKTKDLGPGVPLTFEAAVERLRDMMVAAGTEITLAAVNAAFNVEPKNASEVPAVSEEATRSAPGVAQPSGDAPGLHADGGATRTVELGGSAPTDGHPDQG